MANPIDLIVTQDAIKGVDALIAKVTIAREGLLSLGQQALDSSKSVSKISTPSGLNNNTNLNAQINADLQKQREIVEKLHATIAKKAEQSRLAEIRLQQAREKAFDSFERSSQKEAAINAKNEGAYQRIQNSVNTLTKTYQSLAIRKELGNTLTAKEEVQLTRISSRINEYQGALKKVDSSMGNHQRNVGNYASGYNALGNSISQLTREMPAFANSAQTGFMAISNNIPAFQDAIMQLRKGGMSWGGVVKEMGSSLFGLTGIISLATTLLVVLGPKVWDWVKGTDQAELATRRLTGALKAQNEQLAINLKAIKYQEQVDVSLAKRAGASAEEIAKITGKSSRDQVESAKGVTKSIEAQIYAMQSYLSLGTVKAKFDFLMRRNGGDKAKADAELFRREVTYTESNMNLLLQSKKKAYQEEKDLRDASVLQEIETQTEILLENDKGNKSGIKLEEDRLKSIAELRKKELELELATADQILNNEDLYYSDRLTALDADFIKRTEIAKVDYDEEYRLSKGSQEKQKIALINFQLEKIKLIESYTKQKNTIEALDLDPISKLAKSSQDTDPLKQLANSGKMAAKELENDAKEAERLRKEIEKLKESTDNWLSSFSSEFLQNSGMGSLETFFDGTFDNLLKGAESGKEKFAVYFNAISESAQEAFNLIAGYSQANFDAEKKRIEEQQAIAISYAGGSAVAITKINEDAEKRKKEITNRENKAKQKQAIFNIAIDTAQAIMAIWAHGVDPTGISQGLQTAIVGALGAVQIGMVAAQKIPQYFDGTDNHTGGLMLVNDGQGANYKEKVILPNGKEIMPQGRNVLMDAPKGTKVLNHEQQLFEMMQSNGINMTANINRNSGMTAEQMDGVLGKHFAKIQTNVTTFDKNGIRSWSESNGNKTIRDNNRVSRTGYSV